jgi:hypothetical protein
MNSQESITTLMSEIAELKTQLAAKESAVNGHREELKKLLGLVGTGASTKAGRPAGTPGVNVSQAVLAFLETNAKVDGPGVSRADILKQFPNSESAVQAAIRTHKLAGKIFNTTDHRWFYSDPQPVTAVANEVAPVATA